MLLRAFLPAGWMPAEGGRLVICTGQGAVTVESSKLGLPFGEPSQQAPSGKHDAHCAFAGLGAATAPGPLAIPKLLTVTFIEVSTPGHSFITPGRGLAAPPPPSHAPPHLI